MENARIGIFEDDSDLRELLGIFLTRDGHTVVREASTIEEARYFISSLEDQSINVAIVDGNLSERDRSGSDGAEIAQLLRKKLGAVTIIGFSGSNQIEGADFNVKKVDGITSINAIIRTL